MTSQWRLLPHDTAQILAMSRDAGVSPLVAQILLNRGIIEPAAARAFLQAKLSQLHDPESLPGAVEAAERITRAVHEGRKIVVYGDYDVDGVCGTSVLWSCLKLAGQADAAYYIPHRVEEGYGVNAEALKKIAGAMGASLVITVDCGISAVAEAKLARELGLELIHSGQVRTAVGQSPAISARMPHVIALPPKGTPSDSPDSIRGLDKAMPLFVISLVLMLTACERMPWPDGMINS